MTKEDAIHFINKLSYDLGTTGMSDYTLKDGEKLREALKVIVDNED